jgi:competence protein ComEC
VTAVGGRSLDLRLGAGAGAGWLAVLGCVHRSAGFAFTAAAVAIAVGAGVLAAVRGWRGCAALALALFCVGLVLIPLAGRIARAEASPLWPLARQRAAVTATLTVTADPRLLAAKGVAGAPRVMVETVARSVTFAGRAVRAAGVVVVLGDAAPWRAVLPGQRAVVGGDLAPDLSGGRLSVTLFSRGPPRLLGRPPAWQRLAGRIRAALRHAVAVLPEQERGLLPGLVDGDTAGLDPVLAERFRMAGLTHLVAVSGTNVSLLVGAVLLALRRARVRPWVCAGAGGVVLALFVIVARPSASVLRAALMAAIALTALAAGRPRAAVPALAGAVLALLVWQPALAGSPSFAMSVLATAALLVVAPGWARALRDRGVPPGIAEAVAVAAAAHLVTAPVVAAIAGRVSLVAIPANVLAEPVVAPVTVLGFAAAVLAPAWLDGGAALAWLAGWPCRWLVAVADFFGGLHGATIPWPGGATGAVLLAATAGVVGLVAVRAGPRRVLAAAAATALVMFIPVRAVITSWPPSGWVFAACDVGQGDALLLPADSHAAVVVDTGPDPVAIDRCLRDFGISEIPLLVITHFHLDHVAGLPGVVRGRHVARLLTSPLGDPETGVDLVRRIATPRRLQLLSPPAGTALDAGAVHLDVLGPVATLRDTHSDPNNASLVLRAEVAGVRILLPGDAEIEEQRTLLAAGVDLRADVLKVPHHGSAYFDPAFLAAARARVAVISVGLHNDYGHPSPLLLTDLARLGVPALRTDRDGDVAVVGSPGRVTAVLHGLPASTVGISGRPTISGARPTRSLAGAWMAACRLARSPSTTCPTRCLSSSCSWATRNCWSTARSARSPPRPVAPIRRSPTRT